MTAAPDATPDHSAMQGINTEAVFTNGDRPAATA